MVWLMYVDVFFFFKAEDGIRDLVRSRGLGDVYKRQGPDVRYRAGYRDAVARRQRQYRRTGLGADNIEFEIRIMLSLIHI